MVARRKKKYESGEGAQYISRKAALKYLQLTLKDFRRLCILKGVYPREPRNRRKAQKGKKTIIQTLYHKKDIQFLLHEPIVHKIRDLKVFSKKMGRAHALKDREAMALQLHKHPTFKLDHIVKERYPTFIDALHDLDDCLTLCFLFSTFPSLHHVPRDQSALCRRLTVEFLHSVIQARALRKVFVSIKGYYYQAEIKGQTVTWITPHHFSFEPQSKDDVDFRIMSTFVQFYTVLLGFANFHLYQGLNLVYPPRLTGYGAESRDDLVDEEVFVAERIAALNVPLVRTRDGDVEDEGIEEFPMTENASEFEEQKAEILKTQKLKTLFNGLKVFLNREVPRESLVFTLRCFGASVSWDRLLFVGASFEESDETITHQIVDRPSVEKQFLSRYYVQPQWVFDSINARELLPVDKYLMGAVLPPHLSPFSNPNHKQEYQPPEERGEDVRREESESEEEGGEEKEEEEKGGVQEEEEEGGAVEEKMKGMVVKRGEVTRDDPTETSRTERQEYKLRERMVQKKHKKLYDSMMSGRKDRAKEIWLLRKKRRLIEEKKRDGEKERKKKSLEA